MTEAPLTAWRIWRHPRPQQVAGRCIGRTDVPVDPRKAKRLAHRIRQAARRLQAPPVIWTSDLERAHAVGRWLRRWGWTHRVCVALSETWFGDWEGRCWSDISQAEVEAWCADFARRPAARGAETVEQLLQRVREVLTGQHVPEMAGSVLAVGHAGWLSAAQWLGQSPQALPQAADWPAALRYGQCWSAGIQRKG